MSDTEKRDGEVIAGFGTVEVVQEPDGTAIIVADETNGSRITVLSQVNANRNNTPFLLYTPADRPNVLGMGMSADGEFSRRMEQRVKTWLDDGVLTRAEALDAAELAQELQRRITGYVSGKDPNAPPAVYEETQANIETPSVPNNSGPRQR